MAMADQPKRPARRVKAAPNAKTLLDPVLVAPAKNGHKHAAPKPPKRGAAAHPAARKTRAPRPALMDGLETELPPSGPLEADVLNPGLRQELMDNLESMIGRLRRLSPGYNPPPFSPRQLRELLEQNVDKIPPELGLGILGKLRKTIGEDMFDVDTWKGMWTMLNYTFDYQADVLKRRMTGEYETDEWGLDREYLDAVMQFFDFMYQKYWRVDMAGLENIPAEGRTLLVANHSGQLPWDGAMLANGILRNHPQQRLVRTLYAAWFPTLPFISDFLTKCGQVLATDENGVRLLQNDELVAVFP